MIEIERRIFWDVNYDQLDLEKDADFIITRVFQRGDVNDIRMCRRYFGDQRIGEALLKTPFLPKNRMYLASAVLDKPINEFRCCKQTQSHQNSYP